MPPAFMEQSRTEFGRSLPIKEHTRLLPQFPYNIMARNNRPLEVRKTDKPGTLKEHFSKPMLRAV